ncbi:MAG: hypothetical protein OJF52_003095 [Nitrospira sp.]|nr:MAG: hypothetical protein OJF52_003095 [Nitrospira sp.]
MRSLGRSGPLSSQTIPYALSAFSRIMTFRQAVERYPIEG